MRDGQDRRERCDQLFARHRCIGAHDDKNAISARRDGPLHLVLYRYSPHENAEALRRNGLEYPTVAQFSSWAETQGNGIGLARADRTEAPHLI